MGIIWGMRSFRYFADVSSNNGVISVQHYSEAGHALLAIKATEGTGYVNPGHLKWCEDAHAQGLTVAHYHFCRPGERNIQAELDNFRHAYLSGWRAGDYVVLDLEVDELTSGPLTVESYAKSFLGKVIDQTGHPPVLYTYQAFREEHLKNLHVPGGRIWLAKYSAGEPTINHPNSLWAWQYTDGEAGPPPHYYSGIGKSDGSILNLGVAARLWVRKQRTK